MFRKILVANRGEIACRILRTCRRLNIPSVAVFSDADASARPVKLADEKVRIGPPPVQQSYLNVAAILEAARTTGADAIHPGYGLLSENAAFARAVSDAGLVFVGPSPKALEVLGDKLRARALAQSVGVEPPPGTPSAVDPSDLSTAERESERLGFPVLIKAAAGGGGIGMQIARDGSQLSRALRSCADRSGCAFGDARVYLEKLIESPRHIEVQVLCDAQGGAVALGERECSVQRRNQKILEESPSPFSLLEGDQGRLKREWLSQAALKILRAAGYVNAGTVEFVADPFGGFWFLEVNARLQVEHPVTEMVGGLDLVELQLRIAAGEPVARDTLWQPKGHAIEVRLYAEDPSKMFFPQPGKISVLQWPTEGSQLRIETGVEQGDDLTPYYDPLIAKIVAWGGDRGQALRRLREALAETRVEVVGARGPAATNLQFLRTILESDALQRGVYDTSLVSNLVRKAV